MSSSFDPSVLYYIHPHGQPSLCIVCLPSDIYPPESYPTRILPCGSSGDAAKLKITSDGDGRAHIRPKSVGDAPLTFDIVRPVGMPNVLILGPTDSKYLNQDWILFQMDSSAFQISSVGLPKDLLGCIKVGDMQALVIQDPSTGDPGSMKWDIVPVSSQVSTSSTGVSVSTETAHVASANQASSTTTAAFSTDKGPTSKSESRSLSTTSSETSQISQTRSASSSAGLQTVSAVTSSAKSGTTPSTTTHSTQDATPTSPAGNTGTHINIGVPVGGSVGGAVVLAILAFAIWKWCRCRSHRRRNVRLPEEDTEGGINIPMSHRAGNVGFDDVAGASATSASIPQGSRPSQNIPPATDVPGCTSVGNINSDSTAEGGWPLASAESRNSASGFARTTMAEAAIQSPLNAASEALPNAQRAAIISSYENTGNETSQSVFTTNPRLSSISRVDNLHG